MTDAPEVTIEVLDSTLDVLIRALREVGKSGQADLANRLAARAWLGLKHEHPRQAERLNGLMHFLARLPEKHENEATPHHPSIPQQEIS